MPQITVSQETYKRLQALAQPFRDTEEDVIARLLSLAEQASTHSPELHDRIKSDLVSSTGTVPHGSDLRATYKGREYRATIDDGKVIWSGRHFNSLSKAAVAVIQSTGSDRPTQSGWKFWEVKTPDSKSWRPISRLKNR